MAAEAEGCGSSNMAAQPSADVSTIPRDILNLDVSQTNATLSLVFLRQTTAQ
jgi:hypothetical protein